MTAYRFGRLVALWCLTVIGIGLWSPDRALANGAPVDIYLSCLPNVCNWGPATNATARAVVAVGEGSVSLEVHGLPRLKDTHYEVWLESRATRQWYSTGKFNVDENGTGRLNVLLDNLPYQEYRMLAISVEPEPDPSPEPDARHALAGMFPNPAATQGSGGTGTGAAGGQNGPAFLPVTGGAWSLPWPQVVAAAAFVACLIGFGLCRRSLS